VVGALEGENLIGMGMTEVETETETETEIGIETDKEVRVEEAGVEAEVRGNLEAVEEEAEVVASQEIGKERRIVTEIPKIIVAGASHVSENANVMHPSSIKTRCNNPNS